MGGKCPSCDTPLDDEKLTRPDSIYGQCGYAVGRHFQTSSRAAHPSRCRSCGAGVLPSEEICSNCGHPIAKPRFPLFLKRRFFLLASVALLGFVSAAHWWRKLQPPWDEERPSVSRLEEQQPSQVPPVPSSKVRLPPPTNGAKPRAIA